MWALRLLSTLRWTTAEDTCTVRIRGSHTNIVEIEKNGAVVWRREDEAKEKGSAPRLTEDGETLQGPVIHRYTLKQILHYIETVPVNEIEFIREAFPMNPGTFAGRIGFGESCGSPQSFWRKMAAS